jgi:uncharacterized protein
VNRPRLSAWTVGVLSGGVFALGLWLSKMTEPSKVLGFLDVTGSWDPSLCFVMAGAVGAHFAWLRWGARRVADESDGADAATTSSRRGRIDGALLLGAAIFGVGWGMAGYCPGPALVALAWGRPEAALFVLAMAGGVASFNALWPRAEAPDSLRELV